MNKIWKVVKFVLGGSIVVPNCVLYVGLAFATYGPVSKSIGISFGILAIVSGIFSITWSIIDSKKTKKN